MKIELKPWTLEDKKDLARLCHNADRQFLSDRLPYPYTEDNAQWWIGMAEKQEGKDGIFRAMGFSGQSWQMERSLEIFPWREKRMFTEETERSAIC